MNSMKAPNKIYIDENKITELGGIVDAIVPDERVEEKDICYIRKDMILKAVKKQLSIAKTAKMLDDFGKGVIAAQNLLTQRIKKL